MESGHCVQSVSAEEKRLFAIFLWVVHGRGIAYLPKMSIWRLILLAFLPSSPVYEKLNPSPQAALQRVPHFFPFLQPSLILKQPTSSPSQAMSLTRWIPLCFFTPQKITLKGL